MGRPLFLRTVRGRLLLAAICVETVMLTLMVGNGLRVLNNSLIEQTHGYADQLTPVLRAALVTPLAQRDYATLQAILDESHSAAALHYLAVSDNAGKVVAIAGWPKDQPLPQPDPTFSLALDSMGYSYDVRAPVSVGSQVLGNLHFGLALDQIVAARRTQLAQSVIIALSEIVLTAGLLTAIGIWLTGSLSRLTQVSRQVAQGNYTPDAALEGNDDIGRLGAAFNMMSRAVRVHVKAIDHLRHRYELMLQSVGEGIIGFDCQGVIYFANDRAAQLLRIAVDDLVGGDAFAVMGLEGGEGGQGCRILRRRDGGEFWADYVVTPIVGEDAKTGAVVAFRDATLRRQYQESLSNQQHELERQVAERTAELEASRRRLGIITDSLVEGVVAVDGEGQIMFANPAALRVLECGGDFAAMAGRSLDSVVRLRSDAGEGPLLVRDKLAEPALRDDDAVFVLPSARAIPVAYALSPLADGDGSQAGMIISFREIGPLKEAQHEAMQSARLAGIGQLAAGIAHEINTPIQYIGDNLRYMGDAVAKLAQAITAGHSLAAATGGAAAVQYAEAVPDAKMKRLLTELPEAVRESLDGTAQIARIVLSMKEFSHPGTAVKTPSDVNRALDNTLTVTRNAWKHVAEVERDFPVDLPLVPCHLGELNQVFLNLIVNAAQAIETSGKPLPGRIAVTTRQDGAWVEICIADSGTGVPKAIRDRIFEPFFTTKPVGKGTGQGLAICRDVVVTKHGGTLEVAGNEGEGATFILRLPLDGGRILTAEVEP
jgi:signal transduction histidine kinase/HAMP domain-containing protein